MAIQLSGSLDLTGSLQISGSINDIYYVDFDLKDSAAAVGRLGWDDGEGTLTLGLSGGNLNIPIGVTNFETAYNEDSSSISKGDVVRVSGAQGNRVAVKKANNWGDAGSATTIALAAETIGVGAEGKVILSGPLKGVNTTAFAEGDLLYVSSTPGGLTNIKPQAPLHEVRVGVAQRIHASVGIINVKVNNGYEIDELHNVRITTASLAHNQLLAYSGSVWRNETIDGLGIATTASLNPVLAYTASLKGAAIVSSSTQIQNYNLFALTASANTFYANQTIPTIIGTQITTPTGLEYKVRDTNGASGDHVFKSFNTEILKLDGGTNKATFADDIILTNGKGIDFSATTNGSGTTSAELLNDYEEGTWTPAIAFVGTPGTVNYVNRTGRYTKIGRIVHAEYSFTACSITSSVGYITVTGLPFTINSSVGGYQPFAVYGGVTFPSSSVVYQQGGTADTKIYPQVITNSGFYSDFTNTNVNSLGTFTVAASYTYTT